MKYRFTQEERRRGAKIRNRLYPDLSRKILAKVKTSQTQSKLAKRAREYERRKTEEIKKKFDHIYFPTSVCDRIATKNGKVYLIEIKKSGSKLTKEQARIKKLLNDSYIVAS